MHVAAHFQIAKFAEFDYYSTTGGENENRSTFIGITLDINYFANITEKLSRQYPSRASSRRR